MLVFITSNRFQIQLSILYFENIGHSTNVSTVDTSQISKTKIFISLPYCFILCSGNRKNDEDCFETYNIANFTIFATCLCALIHDKLVPCLTLVCDVKALYR